MIALIKCTAENVFLQYFKLSFFNLHLAKNVQLQIKVYKTKQIHPWDGKKLAVVA